MLNSRAYRLDFRITLKQHIGEALPIQKTTNDRDKLVLKRSEGIGKDC